MKLLVVATSVRNGRAGKAVAEWFVGHAKNDARFEVELVDLKELDLPYDLPETLASTVTNSEYTDSKDIEWATYVNEADAVVFVMPEYNHGYPASMKNAVDHLYHEWSGKPVGFVGYGAAGANFSISAFGLVAAWTHMDTVNAHVAINEIWAAFNESGELVHKDHHEYEATTMLDGLAKKVEAKK